ncbi:MAG: hypothetical protein ACTHM8_03090 [Sphingomonas sp.]
MAKPNPNCVLINGDRQPKASDPHSWLALIGDPPGTVGTRIMFGNLRPTYRGWQNSAADFAAAKLGVGLPPDADPWGVGAARAEVLLPHDVDDRLVDPRTLMLEIDAAPPGPRPVLLTYVTITFDTPRLHEQYELVRAYTVAHLVRELGNAVLVVQHAPHRAGYDTPPHVHLLVRKVTSLGIAPPVAALSSDKGRKLVVEAFNQFRANYEK